MKDINSFEHTKWRCQYHIVCTEVPEKAIYKELRADIGYILRRLCEQRH